MVSLWSTSLFWLMWNILNAEIITFGILVLIFIFSGLKRLKHSFHQNKNIHLKLLKQHYD